MRDPISPFPKPSPSGRFYTSPSQFHHPNSSFTFPIHRLPPNGEEEGEEKAGEKRGEEQGGRRLRRRGTTTPRRLYHHGEHPVPCPCARRRSRRTPVPRNLEQAVGKPVLFARPSSRFFRAGTSASFPLLPLRRETGLPESRGPARPCRGHGFALARAHALTTRTSPGAHRSALVQSPCSVLLHSCLLCSCSFQLLTGIIRIKKLLCPCLRLEVISSCD